MATDISAAPPVQNPDLIDQDAQAPLTNGNGAKDITQDTSSIVNQDSFVDNNALPNTTINVKDPPPDVNPAGPTPVEDVAGGMQPAADFLPKAAPVNSHPTPPPDQPLVSSEADVDTAMANTDTDVPAPAEPESEPAPQPEPERAPEPAPAPAPEQSLVRPREDDDDVDVEDERAMKRTRVEDEPQAEPMLPEFAPAAVSNLDGAVAEEDVTQPVIEQNADVPALKSEPVPPVAAEVPAPAEPAAAVESPPPTNSEQGTAAEETVPAPAAVSTAASATHQQPVEAKAEPSIEAGSATANKPAESSKYGTSPMTALQKSFIQEKTKNLKKTKHAVAFLQPVDPIALNIPAYLDVIKHPMDLSTLDHKLKTGQYGSVQAYVDDFNLIVQNSKTFNGDAHTVTQAAMSMKAYFDKMMETIPSADQAPPPKTQKRGSPAVKAEPRRQPRVAAPPAPAAAGNGPYALQADGVPTIRRDSTNRPARAIKPPARRDIAYEKPKRKENQLELRFAEHALEEIRSTQYGQLNHVFQAPVDPVALNIPHYFQVIKRPMDLSTMAQKLKTGQYGKAGEVRADFNLMIDNCLAFNPAGNPVRDMGIQLRRLFEEIWRGKEKWERAHKPESARGTSASGDEDSANDEEDEDDEPEVDKEQTIQALQKQLADMQNLISGMAGGGTKPAKPKKSSKSAKDSKRSSKIGSLSSAPLKSKAPAPKAKKPVKQKQVSYEEKQEISDAVSNMDEQQVGELTNIITENCSKYKNMEDMELEIDDLPNNVQILLLKYVRRLFGRAKNAAPASPPDDGEMMEDDEDFEPRERGARDAAGKRKKHKPMGKKEQQDTIQNLNAKLQQFAQVGTSGSESPANNSGFVAKAQSSGDDDESEESEEE